jgi:hypothetical protein
LIIKIYANAAINVFSLLNQHISYLGGKRREKKIRFLSCSVRRCLAGQDIFIDTQGKSPLKLILYLSLSRAQFQMGLENKTEGGSCARELTKCPPAQGKRGHIGSLHSENRFNRP